MTGGAHSGVEASGHQPLPTLLELPFALSALALPKLPPARDEEHRNDPLHAIRRPSSSADGELVAQFSSCCPPSARRSRRALSSRTEVSTVQLSGATVVVSVEVFDSSQRSVTRILPCDRPENASLQSAWSARRRHGSQSGRAPPPTCSFELLIVHKAEECGPSTPLQALPRLRCKSLVTGAQQ